MGLSDNAQVQSVQNFQTNTKSFVPSSPHSEESTKTKIKKFDTKKKYGEGKEAAMIRGEMGNFDPMSSDAMQLLKIYYGNSLRLSEIKGIINAIRDYLYLKGIFLPKLSRNANRNYQLCVKYVQDHFEIMKEIIPFVRLHDGQGNYIPVHEF